MEIRIKVACFPGGRGLSLKVGEFLPVWVWASGAKERGRKAGGLVWVIRIRLFNSQN